MARQAGEVPRRPKRGVCSGKQTVGRRHLHLLLPHVRRGQQGVDSAARNRLARRKRVSHFFRSHGGPGLNRSTRCPRAGSDGRGLRQPAQGQGHCRRRRRARGCQGLGGAAAEHAVLSGRPGGAAALRAFVCRLLPPLARARWVGGCRDSERKPRRAAVRDDSHGALLFEMTSTARCCSR